jgi:hypothetical protein
MDWLGYIPWFAWIALAGILIYGIPKIISAIRGTDAAVIDKLNAIDDRVKAIEKTLNDIP